MPVASRIGRHAVSASVMLPRAAGLGSRASASLVPSARAGLANRMLLRSPMRFSSSLGAAAGTGMHNGFDPKTLAQLTPHEQRIIERRQKLLGPSYQLMYEHPVELVKGQGSYMYDPEGNAYLDCYNNVVSVGHCNPRVVEAVYKQMQTLNTHTRYMNENILDYSEQLLETFEPHLGRVMYTCSASESVDLALRVAKFNTRGTGIIVTDYAYHGTTDRVASISSTMGNYVPLDRDVRTIRAPDSYRCDDVAKQLEQDIHAAVDDMEKHGIKFAGFIADMAFSTDGLFTEPAGFLQKAIDAVHQRGGLFIADEVQPGFGRTGTHMWGYQRHDIHPDLVVMGKPMGNGIPVAAMVARPELLEEFGDKVRYFNTFGGNPVSLAAARATLDEIQGGLRENSRKMGDYILNAFREIQLEYPQIGHVRGAGMYFGVEYVKDRISKEPDAALAAAVVREMRERRILISTMGPVGNTLKIRPLISFTQKEADELINGLRGTMEKLCGKAEAHTDRNEDAFAVKQIPLSTDFAEGILREYYNFEGKAHKHNSERDQTFSAKANSGKGALMIKFSNPGESHDDSNLQTELILWLNRHAPDVKVPHQISASDGQNELHIDCLGQKRYVRANSFLPGVVMIDTPRSVQQAYNHGIEAAKVTKGLEGFSHPGMHQIQVWDLQHAPINHKRINVIKDPVTREKLERIYAMFQQKVAPKLDSFRRQLVHNDHSAYNSMVDAENPEKITGIIDFGDAVETAIVFDAAIGAYYHLGVGRGEEEDVLKAPIAFLQGYTSVVKLLPEEAELLHDLLLVRIFNSLIISHSRAQDNAENAPYLLRFLPDDMKHLDVLLNHSESEKARLIKAAGY